MDAPVQSPLEVTVFITELILLFPMLAFIANVAIFEQISGNPRISPFCTVDRLKKIIIGVGDEFDSTDTASFDPLTFTRCVSHPG